MTDTLVLPGLVELLYLGLLLVASALGLWAGRDARRRGARGAVPLVVGVAVAATFPLGPVLYLWLRDGLRHRTV